MMSYEGILKLSKILCVRKSILNYIFKTFIPKNLKLSLIVIVTKLLNLHATLFCCLFISIAIVSCNFFSDDDVT